MSETCGDCSRPATRSVGVAGADVERVFACDEHCEIRAGLLLDEWGGSNSWPLRGSWRQRVALARTRCVRR